MQIIPNATPTLRRVVLWGLLAGLSGAVWAEGRDARLPLRNLLVEWRVQGQGQTRQTQGGIQTGRIVVDSRRGVITEASGNWSTVQTDGQTQSVQQLQVLNGGRARLFVGESKPYLNWQWSMAPQSQGGTLQAPGAVQVWAQTAWLDVGRGITVRPSWPGGRAPVTVELEAQVSQQQPYEPDGQVRRNEVLSTVAIPLGEWAVVARSGVRQQQRSAGSLSTRDLDDHQSEQLEIRITAP